MAPSDSVSQLSQGPQFDAATQGKIAELLHAVDAAPTIRPDYLPPSVLWDFRDCAKDKRYGDIITKANKSQPKMQLALRNEDGTLVSANVYDNMRVFSDLLVHQLLEKFNMDGCLKTVKSVTKSVFKSLFFTEYRQAILALEAEEPLLRLCARHWKAETMISQAFLRRGGGGTESKHDGHSIISKPLSAVPVPSSIVLKPSSIVPVPSSVIPSPAIPMLRDVGDMAANGAPKRSLDLSPGPKSPSASHAQKRVKDNPPVLGLRTSSSLVPAGKRSYDIKISSNNLFHAANRRPTACRLVPMFVSHPEVTNDVTIRTCLTDFYLFYSVY